MSSSNPIARFARLLATFAVLVGLAGCGFAPIYGQGSAAAQLQGRIALNVDETANGYALAKHLEQRLGRAQTDSPDVLTVRIDVTSKNVAIASDDTVVRVTLVGHADYTLTAPDGSVITNGVVNSFTSYSNTGSVVAIQAAQNDANERLARNLANLIVTDLMIAGQ